MFRILQLGAAALVAAHLCGCTPETAATVPSGDPSLAVRRLEGGPSLAVIAREGDPSPMVAAAFAAPGPGNAQVALGEILVARLRGAGLEARATVEGGAIRLRIHPGEGLAATVARAVATPVTANHLEPARPALAAAAREPRPPEAMEPIASCIGRRAGVDGEVTAEEVETLRQKITGEAMAFAVVASPELAETLAAAMASQQWPQRAAEVEVWPRPSHRAMAAPEGPLEVTVALRAPSGIAAAAAATRLAEPSPLAHQLALLEPSWSVAEVSGNALPRGGCLRVTLRTDAEATDWAPMAGAATRLATDELERELRWSGPQEPQRAILTAGTAGDTAELAAWWALHEAVDQPPVAMSAVAVPGRLPATPRDPGLEDDEVAAYRTAAQEPWPAGIDTPPRVVVERGQGELWLLAGQPCAARAESTWDWGRAALTVTAIAAEHEGSVQIEPWVTPEGIGLVAHDAPRGGEGPDELARRVGEALGATLTSLPRRASRYRRAKAMVLDHVASEPMRALAELARLRSPDHPSVLVPWGDQERLLPVTLDDAQQRWRAVLGGPWRFAIHARHSEEEASQAMKAVARWYRSPAVEVSCPLTPAPPPAPAAGPVADVMPGSVLVVGAPAADAAAPWVARALDGPGGLLEGALRTVGWRGEARLIGTGTRRTMAVVAQGPSPELADAQRRIEDVFTELAARGLPAPALAHASETMTHERAAPRARLADTWRGNDAPAAPTPAALAAYCSRLAPAGLSWIADRALPESDPDEEPAD